MASSRRVPADALRGASPRRAAARVLAGRVVALLVLWLPPLACEPEPSSHGRLEVPLSGPGWRLWVDDAAPWEQDPLHLPGVDVATLPARPPTIGWDGAWAEGRASVVPGTVEGELWPERGDVRGVSWWLRELAVPAGGGAPGDGPPPAWVLAFDSVRLRAEVFVDGELVGYDAVGNTPFEVDVSDHVTPGAVHRLAVRVTDPGGNFDWIDHTAHRWGEQTIPASHGFGGVTGDVRLVRRPRRHVADVSVRNTSDPRTVEVEVTVGGDDGGRDGARVQLLDASGRIVAEGEAVPGGDGWPGPARVSLSAPGAELWSLDRPALHTARVALASGDVMTRRFGFRSFEVVLPAAPGERAELRLNGRRVVLRSAISWGFWPVTGMVPTVELARAQVTAARELGLQTLHHHRTIGHPRALDAHDELGLLAVLEPGGYWAQGGDARCRAFARHKWLRMVRAHRSRPSVVAYNMINEADEPPWEGAVDDLLAARRLDPGRVITYTSAWADSDPPELGLWAPPLAAGPVDPARERDGLATEGWHDVHRAPGPGAWRDAQGWRGPGSFGLGDAPSGEVSLRGEEGANAAPPPLDAVVAAFDAAGRDGWDGGAYRAWRDAWRDRLSAMGFLEDGRTLDQITSALARTSHDYQARMIALARAHDELDAYVINGWESMQLENHSGMVDVWRHPKIRPSPLAAAGAPTTLVVAPHERVRPGARAVGAGIRAPATVDVTVFLVDEAASVPRQGAYVLELSAHDAAGVRLAVRALPLEAPLDPRAFGQRLATLPLQLDLVEGPVVLRAALRREGGESVVEGRDLIQLVDWSSVDVPAAGAVTADPPGRALSSLLRSRGVVPRGLDAVDADERLAWVLAAGRDPVPAVSLAPWLDGPLVGEVRIDGRVVGERRDEGAKVVLTPDRPLPDVRAERYAITWRGTVLPTESGVHRLTVRAAGKARVTLAGEPVLVIAEDRPPRPHLARGVALTAGQPAELVIGFEQEGAAASLELSVTTPSDGAWALAAADELLRRAREHGTDVVVVSHAAAWARLFDERGALQLDGVLPLGRYWMGGGFPTRPHPLLEGLPVQDALGWESAELIEYGKDLHGLLLGPGPETVVACVSDHQPSVGSALAVVRWGAGRLVLCTLDVPGALNAPDGAVSVPARLLCNMLSGAGR